MNAGIIISVLREPDDDQLYLYRIKISNATNQTFLDFWGYKDNFKEFGNQLRDFPANVNTGAEYTLGEDQVQVEPKWAYYLHLRAFVFDARGYSAIKVIVDNHADAPKYTRAEFYILAEIANINRLGDQLSAWDPEKTKEISWFSDNPSAS